MLFGVINFGWISGCGRRNTNNKQGAASKAAALQSWTLCFHCAADKTPNKDNSFQILTLVYSDICYLLLSFL